MKKVITTAALLFSACTFMVAQDAASDLKPAAGANNLELNFVPLNGKPISITYIRYRRFLSETSAFRLGVGVSFSSTKADTARTSNMTPGSTINTTSKTSKMGWSIKPGYEKHFAGTNRLSPYIGAELELAGQSSKSVGVNIDAKDELVTTTVKNKDKGGFFRLGVNAIAGFDFYVSKHLYLGTELGFGFQSTMYSKLKSTTSPLATGAKDPDPVSQGKEMNIGPNFNSAIRLGFIF